MAVTVVGMAKFCTAVAAECQKSGQSPDSRALFDSCDKFPPPPPAPITEPNFVPAEEPGFTPFPQFTSVRSLASAPTEEVAVKPPADEVEGYPSEQDADAAYNKAVKKLSNPWPRNGRECAPTPSDGFVVAAAAALGGLIWFANEALSATESTVSAGLNMAAIFISPLQQYIIKKSDLSSAPQS